LKAGLLDVNVLVALAWPSHIHHGKAHEWFSQNASEGWATCPITQSGFVRVSSNPAIIDEAVSPAEAISLLEKMTSHENHIFWADSIELVRSEDIPIMMLAGHRQVTDAYLLGLAAVNNGRLVTLDRGVASLLKTGSALGDHVEVISVD
jgi:toxin-antitoxin system PIN domain toxin